MYKYLIIGNSAGGLGAAEAIRKVDSVGSVAIVTEEECHVYSRAMIPFYLSGKISFTNLFVRPPDFYQKKNISLVLGRVTELDSSRKQVTLESGDRISYEILLIAVGGKPFIPEITGIERKNIFTFTGLQDAHRIKGKLQSGKVKKVVVLGGGLIGLLATEALCPRVDVTVVELADRILSPVLDEVASGIVKKKFEDNGVEIITGHTVKKVLGQKDRKKVSEVVLDGGEKIAFEMLIIAIGVVPRTEITKGTDIKVNRGIVVDHHMETSTPGIFACGDCAEVYDFALDTARLTPLWPNAYVGGMIAGYNMACIKREYNWGTAMSAMHFFGFPVISAGLVNTPVFSMRLGSTPTADPKKQADNFEILTTRSGDDYKKLVLKDEVIVGMVLAGKIERAGILLDLMRRKVKTTAFKSMLLGDDFGLVCVPENMRLEMSAGGEACTT
jgi:NAD(P)H-nitrite reductase large subunit